MIDPAEAAQNDVVAKLQSLPPVHRQAALTQGLKDMQDDNPRAAQESVAGSGVRLPAPSGGVTDKLWIIIVVAFCACLVASAGTLIVSLFVPPAANGSTQFVITVFTSVVAFLGGLFAQSPTQAASSSNPKA